MDEYLSFEVPLLNAIEDDDVQSVEKSLKRGADRAVFVYIWTGRTSAWINLSASRAFGDLTIREKPNEPARSLALPKCVHLLANEASDQRAKRQSTVA